jgi:putative transposase
MQSDCGVWADPLHHRQALVPGTACCAPTDSIMSSRDRRCDVGRLRPANHEFVGAQRVGRSVASSPSTNAGHSMLCPYGFDLRMGFVVSRQQRPIAIVDVTSWNPCWHYGLSEIQFRRAMHYDPLLPNRRSVRIKPFDYAQPAAYFITICAHANRNIFGEVVSGTIRLNELGRIVEESWRALPSHFSNIRLAARVFMPNHLHGIVSIQGSVRHRAQMMGSDVLVCPSGGRRFGAAVGSSIPIIVRSFKSAVSKKARAVLRKPLFQVWQRGYHEHIIRNQDDFERTCEYIRLNPIRWNLDE